LHASHPSTETTLSLSSLSLSLSYTALFSFLLPERKRREGIPLTLSNFNSFQTVQVRVPDGVQRSLQVFLLRETVSESQEEERRPVLVDSTTTGVTNRLCVGLSLFRSVLQRVLRLAEPEKGFLRRELEEGPRHHEGQGRSRPPFLSDRQDMTGHTHTHTHRACSGLAWERQRRSFVVQSSNTIIHFLGQEQSIPCHRVRDAHDSDTPAWRLVEK